jgi:hypothetical protein
MYCRIHSKKIKSKDIAVKIMNALIKNKIKFSSYSEGSGTKSYIINYFLIYGENICAFPHIQYYEALPQI